MTPLGPRFRPDLEQIDVYRPGKPIDETARDLGLDDIIKLASNESPEPPFPEVQQAIAAATSSLNRYPDTSAHRLVHALARHHALPADRFWVGAGSSQLLGCIALSTGGPGASALYARPSFVLYRIATAIAGATSIEVPLDDAQRHDLGAMLGALRDDTRVVYVCNPNNPTGTHVAGDRLAAFIDAVPQDRLVVVDEAYAEYVTAPDYASALPLAAERRNVVVARTFSKVYGLAGLRVGYLVGHPDTLAGACRPQPPFSVNTPAQVAAEVALRHTDRLASRVKANAEGRNTIEGALARRGVPHAPSQTNFVMFSPAADAAVIARALLQRGVIVRRIGTHLRVSVGTGTENDRFIAALDDVTMEAQ
jgi:histidinol-phosphate aminotransferase